MNGFLNINKDSGITSYDVIRHLKRIFPRRTKLGHLGTLDPMASGVLPVAIGQGTKIIPYLGEEGKEYIAKMTLGGVSDTQDAYGNISYTGKITFDNEKLKNILLQYTGSIEQIPPMYSAVHHKGKRLYELAREGLSVERPARKVEIKSIQLLEVDIGESLPSIKIKVECSRGTYIRTLCHDIGNDLGTGAYLTELVRTKSGVFTLDCAYKLQDIMDERDRITDFLLSIDYPLTDMATYFLQSEKDVEAIKHGNSISTDGLSLQGKVKIYAPDGELLAIGSTKVINGEIFIKPDRVFN